MTQRLESVVHAVVAGILGTGAAVIVMLAFDVLRHGAARSPNWGTAVCTRHGDGGHACRNPQPPAPRGSLTCSPYTSHISPPPEPGRRATGRELQTIGAAESA